MMRTFAPVLAMVSMLIAGAATAQEQRGSPQDAKRLLDKAVAHYQAVGRDKALSDFTAKADGFIDRDLYVFCIGQDKKMSAHGFNSAMIGKDITIFKDANGRQFALEMFEVGISKGSGEVDYPWVHPATKKIENKSTYFSKVGNDVCAVGFYK